MQDLLLHLLQGDEQVSHTVHRLVHSSPEYLRALEQCRDIERQVRAILGFPLYDAYTSAFLLLSCYENRAYYAVGLGLRAEIAKLWVER